MNRSIELWIPLMVPGLLIATVGAGDQTPQISSQAESLRDQVMAANGIQGTIRIEYNQ